MGDEITSESKAVTKLEHKNETLRIKKVKNGFIIEGDNYRDQEVYKTLEEVLAKVRLYFS